MPQKTFYNNLLAIRKSNVTLTLNKPPYVGMSNLELRRQCECTNSMMITLKINIATTHDYYSQTLII